MRNIFPIARQLVLSLFIPAGFLNSTLAQEVSIPDPDLNAAIRERLQIPTGPLTEEDLLGLTNLNACCRGVKSVEGLEFAHNLVALDLENNQLASFNFSSNLIALEFLNLSSNPLTNLFFPDGLTNLVSLAIESSGLTNITMPAGLTGLIFLQLGGNQLRDLTLPADLKNLNVIDLSLNQLTNLVLHGSLTNLSVLALQHNQLTILTLPPELPQLSTLLLGGNPLTTLVLSEPAAATLAVLVASLRSGGIEVFTYPLDAQLIRIRQPIGAFQFAISGPPGIYTVLGSTNFSDWSELGVLTNSLGKIVFTDGTANLSPQKFYRALAMP